MAKKKKTATYDVVALQAEYNVLEPTVIRFTAELAHQLEELIGRAGIALTVPLQRRVKTWRSIDDKLQRLSLPMTSLTQMQDLVGFRAILQFSRDVATVCTLLSETFRIVDRYDTVDRLREDQFGYSSVHFVLQLPEAWLAVPTMADMGGLQAEVQVRTAAQHIWATASHTLQYKHEASVPPQVRRSIHRVSALLETVDLEFERVLSERDAYKAAASSDINLDEELNVDLLVQVLDELWPAQNKDAAEEYAELLQEMQHFGITTRRKLTDVIRVTHAKVMAEEKMRVAEMRQLIQNGKGAHYNQNRASNNVFFLHTGLTRRALASHFGEAWQSFIKNKVMKQLAAAAARQED